MPFCCTSDLFEHPLFFCHHLNPSPFADFDDYMLSENFVFLDSEYFPSWRLELIFGLMHGFLQGGPHKRFHTPVMIYLLKLLPVDLCVSYVPEFPLEYAFR